MTEHKGDKQRRYAPGKSREVGDTLLRSSQSKLIYDAGQKDPLQREQRGQKRHAQQQENGVSRSAFHECASQGISAGVRCISSAARCLRPGDNALLRRVSSAGTNRRRIQYTPRGHIKARLRSITQPVFIRTDNKNYSPALIKSPGL